MQQTYNTQPQPPRIGEKEARETLSMPPHEHVNIDVVKEMLDPAKSLTIIEFRLKGFVQEYNPEKKEWEWIKKRKEMLNEDGVNEVMAEIEARVNPVLMLSYLDDEEVHRITASCSQRLLEKLFLNKEKFEIQTDTEIACIVNMVDDMVLVACKRALLGNEKKFWSKIAERKEIAQQKEMPRKRKLLGFNW